MNKDLHNIDDLFKKSIEDHTEEVPTDVWNTIDHNLDKKQVAFYKRKYFAFRAAAILLVLIAGITIAAILHFNQPAKEVPGSATNENAATSNDDKNNEEVKEPASKQTNKQIIIEKKKIDEQKTVFNNDETKTSYKNDPLNNNKADHNKENLKEKTTATIISSAPKKDASTVANYENKLPKKKAALVYRPAMENSKNLIAGQFNKLKKQAVVNQENTKTEDGEVVKNFSRTSNVNDYILNREGLDFITTLSSIKLSGSGIILTPSSLPPAKKLKSKISLDTWSISPTYARGINLNSLRDDDRFRDMRNNSREAKRTEPRTTSFTAGIGIQKQISKHLALQTGCYYFSSQTHIQPKIIFARPDGRGDVRYQFQCSSGNSYINTKTSTPLVAGDSIKTNFSRSKLSYFQVPLLVAYKISLGKFSFIPAAGFQTNMLLNSKLNSSLAHSTGDEDVSGSIDGLKPMYFSGVVQPQINYQLNDRISFDLDPNINFSLSPINKETAVKTYQNMISVGAGIKIKL